MSSEHPYTLGLLKSLPRVDEDQSQRLASIDGLPPVLMNKPIGCPFAPRCTYVIEKCLVENPPLMPVGPEHNAACWVDPKSGRARE